MSENTGLTLDKLPVGAVATIVKVLDPAQGHKKFADVGLVPGTELLMQAHAPFGGLLRGEKEKPSRTASHQTAAL